MARFLVVANRLPVHRVRDGWRTSPGGLVSALLPILQRNRGTWVGWTGVAGKVPAPFELDGFRNVPVRIAKRELEEYYEGFSNRTLWPLYHDVVRTPVFHRGWWRTYVDVNRRFARAIDAQAAKGAVVWVQDYHLHLVPRMLRELRPDLRIGFFLHIPFPPQELFARLPWRKQVLSGTLGADVVGFQTRVGAQNFQRLCRRYLGAEVSGGRVAFADRTTIAGAFPISIDFARFDGLAREPRVVARSEELREALGGRRILLGVDRLDYTKGIDKRLQAYGELLDAGAVDPAEAVLVQTAVPSRELVNDYKEQKELVERLVGGINGHHDTFGRSAVHYVHRSLPPEELAALYRAADVMLVTPLRDGMNLVAKEFVAARCEEDGVLVLSEFAGAARELHRALLVNPYDVDGLAERIHEALHVPAPEARRRMRLLRARVRKNDVHAWAERFLEVLTA
jgi:trehalose 6-phosphate synthase